MNKKLLLAPVVYAVAFVGTAAAQITVVVTPNPNPANGVILTEKQAQTFDIALQNGPAAFQKELNAFFDGSPGLSLSVPTVNPPIFQCGKEQRDGRDFVTCNGGVVNIAPNSTVHVLETITLEDGSAPIFFWHGQFVGTALSGFSMITGTVVPTTPKPKLVNNGVGPGLNESAPNSSSLSPGQDQSYFDITNVGTAAGTFAETTNATFFKIDCASGHTVAPQKTARCYINATPQKPGWYGGTISITGDGIDGVIKVQVVLVVDVRPTGTPKPHPASSREDAASSGGSGGRIVTTAANPTVSIPIINDGDGAVRGVISADKNWVIVPQAEAVIEPGETKNFDVSVDLASRPFAIDSGSLIATVSLRYLLPASAKTGRITSLDAGGTSSVSITLVSTVPPQSTTATPPSLAAKCPDCFTDTAVFIPGVGHVVGSVGQFISDL